MKRFLAKFLITFCLLFLLAGCGLETGYYTLDEPTASHSPSGTEDAENNYWEFIAPHGANDAAYPGFYKGVKIYYKIYNNTSTLNTHINAIYTANDNSSSTEKYDNEGGFNKLNSYGYKGLYTSSDIEFINHSNSDVRIKLRLVDDGDFGKSIVIAGSDTGVYPYRSAKDSDTEKQDFAFDSEYFPKSENNNNNDGDVVISTTATKEGTWYINAYAVCTAQDEGFQSYHSRLCHLGYITIKQKD